MGQLLTEKKNGTVVTTMTYDNYGNIKTKNGTAYTYDTTWKDKLTKVGTKSIVYDASGNPTNYLGTTLIWEKGRQLKKFGSYTYQYNKDGIRTQKIENGKTHDYILDGTSIIKEIVNNGDASCQGYTNEYLYDIDGSVCGIIYNGTAYYFYKNLQGDVISITDGTGTVKAAYTYDAWGKCTVASDTSGCNIANINPFRYRGYYYDTETQLYYLQSRYYDPEVGRFICSDEIYYFIANNEIERLNLFQYCSNSPIILIDFTGFWAEKYSGFRITTTGFSVNYSNSFLSRTFCEVYAINIIHVCGGFSWRYGYSFKKMGIIRIAKELYAHAVLYVIGRGILQKVKIELILDACLKALNPRVKLKGMTIAQKLYMLELGLGEFLTSHARVIDVNNDESKKRLIVFDVIWFCTFSI